MYITISIEEGQQYRIGTLDVKGELLESAARPTSSACRPSPATSSTAPRSRRTCRTSPTCTRTRATPTSTRRRRPGSTTRGASSISASTSRRGRWSTSSASTSAATARRATRSSGREMRIYEGEQYSQQRHRPVQAARQLARLLRQGRGHHQARLGRRHHGRQRRGRRAPDRRLPNRRRLLLGRVVHLPGADLAEQPPRPRPVGDPAGAGVRPAPALHAAVRGHVLPRHQLDLRLQPVQPATLLPGLHPQVDRRQPDLGLHAHRQRPPVPDLHPAGRRRRHRRAAATCSPADSAARCRPTRSPTCCIRAFCRPGASPSRTTPATTACSRTVAGTTRCRRSSPSPPSCRRASSPATRGRFATTTRCGGRSPCASRPRRAHHQSGSAGRAHLRALLRRRHLRHPRLPALFPGPQDPGAELRLVGIPDPDAPLKTFSVGGNLRVLGKAEIEIPIFDKMGIRGVVFTDVGNAYNLEDQYCRLKPAWARRLGGPLREALPAHQPAHAAGASASVGSRPSARCASSGACRSRPCRARTPSSSNSPSATSYRR